MNDQYKNLLTDLESKHRKIYRSIRNGINKTVGSYGLTNNELNLLRILSEGSPMNCSAISKKLEVSPSHVTVLADQLFEKDLVKRTRSSNDRRIVEYWITNNGLKICAKIEKIKEEYLLNAFSNLSVIELQVLISIYEKLADGIIK